jgi:DNA-directed DNA polymerase III PolC
MADEPAAYAELHCLSNFTFLRGASHPQELMQRACAAGYEAIALTDECSVAGVVRALVEVRVLKTQNRHIRLIVGSEFRLTCGLRFVALAPNRKGYGKLCRLITHGRRSAKKGSYALSRMDVQALLSDCLILWLPGAQPDASEAQWLSQRFLGNVWIAVELLCEGRDRERLAELQALGREVCLPLVAAGDVHMHVRSRRKLQDVLTAIRHTVPIAEAGWRLYPNGERHLRTRERLARLYPPELLAETLVVARRCEFSLEELQYEYPRELVPSGQTPTTYLRQLVEEGARDKWPEGMSEKTRRTIENELSIIATLKYEPFFLTVQDIVRFARSKGILCQGRGSAANSVVCFCLGVTSIDPERNEACLLVERFISVERNEPPDIDIDFEHGRREEVIQYVYGKYGRERSALAATVIMYRPRSALRDIGKAFGLDPLQVARLAKTIQWWDGNKIDKQRVREAGVDPDSPVLLQIMSLAREIMEFPRHLSQHVGGIVISQGRLDELVPIENATMADRTVVQWDKDDLNDLKLLKVDLLGLGMLSALRRAFGLVNDYWAGAGKYPKRFTLGTVPPEDPRVYDMMGKADTVGVFQIESRAQMSMLPRLQPKKYYDLVIEVAIVRPGPIQGDMVHPYLRRRAREEAVTYPSPEVRGVLERTLGVPIFQEQVMQLAMVAAGFTGGEADSLRRAMAAWKKRGGLESFKDKLINGMLERGYPQEFAERIFKQMLGFGEYGFPECVVGETRVVDADTGRWVTIDDVMSGQARLDNTFACDNDMRLRKRKVLAVVASGTKPVWRLRTALGHSIVATAEHPFMAMDGWRQLGALKIGDRIAAARTLPMHARRRWPWKGRQLEHCTVTVTGDEPLGRFWRLVGRRSAGCKGGFRRFVIDRLATVLRTPDPARPANSDIYWDEVVSIEKLGSQPTYDLQIEGDHNFLANNLVVHNSHAASFALLVYDSAWLKCYEPAAFTCALLNSLPMGFYAPAQLVRDAREHGVEVRPVRVESSYLESTLEPCESVEGMRVAPALRLGMKLVKSLSATGAQRIEAVRAVRPFQSVQDLAERAALDRADLEALAAAGALASLSGNRHLAFWEVAGTERSLPLAPRSTRTAGDEEGRPLLTTPTDWQTVVADYSATGLTLGAHPLQLLRDRLARARFLRAADLQNTKHGTFVRVAGIVLMRQHPGSANGVTFMTVEDETGSVNIIVWERISREQRRPMLESRLLEVQGELQRQHGVTHVIAQRLIDRSGMIGELLARSRDFH